MAIQGGLFTRDFLLAGVEDEPAWRALSDAHVEAARTRLNDLASKLLRQHAPNEAETEAQLIFPVLEQVLGWPDWLPQQNQSASGRKDVPDALLFADAEALERARPEPPWRRFQHGLCLVESKRWKRPLDRPVDAHDRQPGEEGVPSAQVLRYLRRADDILLPGERGAYADYSLRRIRREVSEARTQGRAASPRAGVYWARLRSVFDAIAHGDDGLGVPPYNGGLFEPQAAPILGRLDLPDSVIAEVVFALSHVQGERGPKYVNYRDLSVQQLGSVYERILEFGLKADEAGGVSVDPDDAERHDSGSYYTPEALVSLIIERAVGPAVDARSLAFAQAAQWLGSDRRPTAARLEELAALDPASAMLELKVCDPAMGSGHFLVSLVDWLADRVLAALAEAPEHVGWAPYASPLLGRIAAIRERILAAAREHGWPILPEQLDDRHLVRRMILKRVVHGVDKNPFAVELAKVALWLHTFTVGAPLSFLDHHLRCGDSVVGAWVRPTLDAVAQAGGLLSGQEIARVEGIAALMTAIEQTTDNDVAEVKASADAFGAVGEGTRELDAFFSLMTARPALDVDLDPKLRPPKVGPDRLRVMGAAPGKIATAEKQQAAYDRAAAFKAVLERQFGDPLKLASGEAEIAAPQDDGDQLLLSPVGEGTARRRGAATLVAEARALARRERFLHWELTFPNVWRGLTQPVPRGGFDAVIGNPPYVRQERLAAVKPALAAGYATFAGAADLYVYFFEQGLRLVKPGGRVAYVVTNKWLKAGYAERLRALLLDPARAELESLIDFGHARAFFPDADVFPNVAVVRRPDGAPASETLSVAVPPRETLPDARLPAVVAAASFPLARAALRPEGWSLEPKPVMDLLAKICRAGVPLVDYAGVKPLYGIKTGFNEAFLIDTPTRDRLVAADPASAEIIKPYLRGQDVQRWSAPDSGLHMILLKSSSDFAWPWAGEPTEAEAEACFAETYPALHAHMKRFESLPGEKPGELKGLRHREDHGRFWWELRPSRNYEQLSGAKLIYPDITWSPSFMLDRGRVVTDLCFFLPSGSAQLCANLNSPVAWWFLWRHTPHGKDDALRCKAPYMERFPVGPSIDDRLPVDAVLDVAKKTEFVQSSTTAIHDWLRLEFGLDRPGRALERPERLDADGFAAAVRAALPRRRRLSAAEIARLKREHADTIAPARRAAAEALTLERRLSDLVNAAYGLTPEDVALMWRTAPPRTPLLTPAGDAPDTPEPQPAPPAPPATSTRAQR